MRIVITDTTAGSDLIGGAQLFLPKLLRGLVGNGRDVSLITNGRPNEKVQAAIEGSAARVVSDLWDGSMLVDDIVAPVARFVNDERPDAFVVSVSGDIGWAVLPHLDPSIATLTIGHNDEETFYAPVRHYRDFLTRAVGVSEQICDAYVNDCQMLRERVDWIPYGVETRDRAPETFDGPIRLIYVGRFEEEQKRISDVVGLIGRLTAENVDYRFTLVGDGEAMPEVRSALAGEVQAGRVRLTGWLGSEEVLRELNESDIFVLASAYEGFCISLTEAMANGCMPVVTDIRSGNKQLVRDGDNGFVVPVGDIEAFVDRIKLLAGDRGRLLGMRESAWKTGREYSIGRMVDNYERCFETAIQDARTVPRTPDPEFPLMPSCRSKYPLWVRRLKARALSITSRG